MSTRKCRCSRGDSLGPEAPISLHKFNLFAVSLTLCPAVYLTACQRATLGALITVERAKQLTVFRPNVQFVYAISSRELRYVTELIGIGIQTLPQPLVVSRSLQFTVSHSFTRPRPRPYINCFGCRACCCTAEP